MNDDSLYLGHILEAIKRIENFTRDGFENFMTDLKTQDAALRNLEIIGEAVKRLSEKLRTNNPEVPWKRMAGMRDRLAHDYMGVNLPLVWETIMRDLPSLKRKATDLQQASDAGSPGEL